MKIGFLGVVLLRVVDLIHQYMLIISIKNNIIDISELDNKVKIWGNTERECMKYMVKIITPF